MELASVYMISKYTTERAPNIYKPVPEEYTVKFHSKIIVYKVNDATDIPRLKFEPKKFREAREVITLMGN